MKFIKNNIKIFIIIITIILIENVSVYAAYKYFAKDVYYTKSDGSEININDALNELYTNSINLENSKLLYTYNSDLSFSGKYKFDGTNNKAIIFLCACSRDNNVITSCEVSNAEVIFDKTLSNRYDVYSNARIIIIDNVSDMTEVNYLLQCQPEILIYGL